VDLNNSKKIIFITGATSGIGEAAANLLSNKYNLILCGRREERLLKIKNRLSKKTEVITLNFDVRNKEDVTNKINSLPDKWKKINILINNAGTMIGRFLIDEGDISDWDKMIDINVKGLLYVTKQVLSFMLIQNSWHIINVGSIAGKEVYPKGNVYCASKFAVDALSEGMRLDLVEKNIKDLKKISDKIKSFIDSNKKIHIEKSNSFYQIIIVEKNLEYNQGIFYNLINFETESKLPKEKENCNYIQSLNDIKSSKEYELNKLNENIKNNLKDINDFLIFENNNKLNYIFLCQIKVNDDFLKEVNISKKINFIAKNIELDFINKYAKQYNAKKYYE